MAAILGPNATREEAVAALKNRNADSEDLAVTAERFPDLRPAVAAHPAAYPELLEWLTEVGDPTIALIVAARLPDVTPVAPVIQPTTRSVATQSARIPATQREPEPDEYPIEQHQPVSSRHEPRLYDTTRKRPIVQYVIIGLLALAAICVGLLVYFVLWPSSGDSDPQTSPTAAPTEENTPTQPSDTWTTDAAGIVQPETLESQESWAIVTVAATPLYSGPAATYTEQLSIPDGGVVRIVGQMTADTGFVFVHFLVDDGMTGAERQGWISSTSYSLPADPPIWPEQRIAGGTYATVTSDLELNLRAGPGTEYDILSSIPSGTQVEQTGFSDSNTNRVFVRHGHIEGWVSADYLSF